ncbi:hypothetical protein JMA_39150 (plasmid) [Jeotgalibacillus malaysiensis]|uniref:Uncharacterized protein n=1 Tax=Jeotgalibacillus malaysiensis TaxID=1508404 RepID=A0A0B5AXD4_9BACL|nr:hypothetical protein [Jeotgalibacillus malaysiensis]AJD93233.1 hypothetical protein JMA_39150 [Jeotgalibacillus malaysiensis]
MNKQKKYEMIEENNVGVGKFRIRALRDIPKYGVKKGDMGGLIDSELNLPHDTDGWVSYDSRVLHSARVVHGYVCEESILCDESILHEGMIKHSEVRGNSELFQGTHVEHSLVKNCQFFNSAFIYQSTISGMTCYYRVSLKYVKVKPLTSLYVNADINWHDVKMEIDTGFIELSTKMKNVAIQAEELDVDTVLNIENARLKAETFIKMSRHRKENDYCTEIKGEEASPIQFKGSHLTVEGSKLSGSVTLKGDLSILYSTLSDMASIQMNGTLIDCEVSEMAKVVGKSEKTFTLDNRELSGDSITQLR